MKAVLISIKPKWVEKIANGEKTIEVRKTAPKLKTPFKCYIYKTKATKLWSVIHKGDHFYGQTYDKTEILSFPDLDGGKVIGEFVCDKVYEIKNCGSQFLIDKDIALTNRVAKGSCLDYDDMCKYFGIKDGYGWHISDLKIYDKPKEISEFHYFCTYPNNTCEDCAIQKLKPHCHYGEGLTRPPQSWQYIEENYND